ncbi:MAG TPA: hypothetical protein VIM12_05635 [Noviherbaspirillum sp.]|jgi:hypothetical protein|uniref:hypothetical protein n=1 Tax=Noviherbaspirillum sp. TaxID=1926288 RepID=UPI002F941F11
MTTLFPLEASSPADAHVDFCLWDYAPPASPDGKLRPVNLLRHSLRGAGIGARADEMVQALRDGLGDMKTVWGVKQAGDTLAWEFYFYDYTRRARSRSMTRVLDLIRPWVGCNPDTRARINEASDYFMFSLDFDAANLDHGRPLDEIQLYMGNPGSAVSSGICYALRPDALRMKNFYFFFDARTQMRDIVGKITSSVFLDLARFDLDALLWPELRDCQTIVVANKPTHDGIYFSRITIDQLLIFLARMRYPADQLAFARQHRAGFDHLLFDVGIDYRMEDGQLKLLKSAYYGVF